MYMRVKHRPFYRVVAETWSASATRGFHSLGSEEGKPPGRGAFAPMNLVFPRVLTWALGRFGDDRESRKVPIGSPRTLQSEFLPEQDCPSLGGSSEGTTTKPSPRRAHENKSLDHLLSRRIGQHRSRPVTPKAPAGGAREGCGKSRQPGCFPWPSSLRKGHCKNGTSESLDA